MVIAIPEGMEEFLKAKAMLGEHRPIANIRIDGLNAYTSGQWTDNLYLRCDPRDLDHRSAFYDYWAGGSFVTRKDGKILLTYVNASNHNVYLSLLDSEYPIFHAENQPAPNEWVFYTMYSPFVNAPSANTFSRLQKLKNGALLLYIEEYGINLDSGHPNKLMVYKSENGLGTDFELISTPYTYTKPANTLNQSGGGIGIPIELASGRILLPWSGFKTWDSYQDYCLGTSFVSFSDDYGVTWTTRILLDTIYQDTLSVRGIANFNGILFAACYKYYARGSMAFWYSADSGNSWTKMADMPTDGYINIGANDAVYWCNDGFNYWVHYIGDSSENPEGWGIYKLYRRKASLDLPLDTAAYDRIATWEYVSDLLGDDGMEVLWMTEAGNLAFCGTSWYGGGSVVHIMGLLRDPIILPVKSISVNNTKGMASQATVVLDNKGGLYSPDNSGSEYFHVLWPSKEVRIELGYGDESASVFTGLIDQIKMHTWPQDLTLTMRDYMKLALDQKVSQVVGDTRVWNIAYTGETPEFIFRDLAKKAGWSNDRIETGASGMTIEYIQFVHESYADAFQKLAEFCGFEWYADSLGNIWFMYATDRQPQAVSDMKLEGTTMHVIPGIPYGHPAVRHSAIVKSLEGLTTYTEGTDYVVDLGGENKWVKIGRTADSNIGDGDTVNVAIVFAAWVFREGEDIFSLDYTIDDKDVYQYAIALSQDADGNCVWATAQNSSEFYILPQKALFIQADQVASTSEQCMEVARRAIKVMNTKPRESQFVAVGNPYIQVGDCVQVRESSSRISEIYRITTLQHSMVASEGGTGLTEGQPIYASIITCYHYGYAPA